MEAHAAVICASAAAASAGAAGVAAPPGSRISGGLHAAARQATHATYATYAAGPGSARLMDG
jgi:hypothetical protein